jgi:uncharacterized protein (TIGR02246 family)
MFPDLTSIGPSGLRTGDDMVSRWLKTLCGGVIALAIALPSHAGPREDAFELADDWAAAFNTGNVEKIVALYAPEALVLGTLSPTLASTQEDLRKYFGPSSASKSQVKLGQKAAAVLSNDAVAMTGFYEFSRLVRGKEVVTPARFTFIFVRRDEGWRIVHHHSSVRPKPAQ